MSVWRFCLDAVKGFIGIPTPPKPVLAETPCQEIGWRYLPQMFLARTFRTDGLVPDDIYKDLLCAFEEHDRTHFEVTLNKLIPEK